MSRKQWLWVVAIVALGALIVTWPHVAAMLKSIGGAFVNFHRWARG
jgi:hypothetical protein